MADCLDGKPWDSNVAGGAGETGKFSITTEQANGDFVGEFLNAGGQSFPISGNCSAGTIWFDKPANNPNHRYAGTFLYVSGSKQFIVGKRYKHSDIFTLVNDVKEAADRLATIAGDDWTGTKGT